MFSIIGAILGGGFLVGRWFVKKSFELSEDTDAVVHNLAYNIRKQEWLDKVTDEELEDELSYKVRDEYAFFRRTQNEIEERFGIRAINYNDVVRYLLAQQGKLMINDTVGISVCGAQKYDRRSEERWRNEVGYIKWIHEQIREGDSEARLLFERSCTNTPIDAGELVEYSGGRFIWSKTDRKTYVRENSATEEELWMSKIEDLLRIIWFFVQFAFVFFAPLMAFLQLLIMAIHLIMGGWSGFEWRWFWNY